MPDRLRDLLDLVVGSLDDDVDGRELARRAHFSRDHLDRLLLAATGETPVQLRRRLLLERAAWHLRTGARPSEAATAAGYGSTAAFSRAFSRAFGAAPSVHDGPPLAEAPNGVHFHPPGGLLLPVTSADTPDATVADLRRHLARTRPLLEAAGALPRARLDEPRRPGFVVTSWEGEEPTAGLMAERLVFTLEVWAAAIAGEPCDGPGPGALRERHARAGARLVGLFGAIGRRRAWSAGFVDALCEPPQSFTYGWVLEHLLDRGEVRREALASVLAELG